MADEEIVFRTLRLPVALDQELNKFAQDEGRRRGEIVYPMDLMRTLIEEALAKRVKEAKFYSIIYG